MPYEIHVTIRPLVNGSLEAYMQQFKEFEHDCMLIDGVKPLLLANYSIENDTVEYVMLTSSAIKGTARDADKMLNDITSALRPCGYDIGRQKIETVPWHPAATNISRPINSKNTTNSFVPSKNNGLFYFENHMKVKSNNFELLKAAVNSIRVYWHTDSYGISWNILKDVNFGIRTYFVTYRSKYKTKIEFIERAKTFADHIRQSDGIVEVSSEDIEFCIYDTAENQDKSWITTLG